MTAPVSPPEVVTPRGQVLHTLRENGLRVDTETPGKAPSRESDLESLQRILEENERARAVLSPVWNDYIPHKPTGKQLAFLMLPNREAFFGGAAGGGKSDALLMAALQYVTEPNYAAIIFRKTFTDLKLPGALIDRSHQWLGQTDAMWNGNEHVWLFPSGAKLQFGYLESEFDMYRYQSSEFQFVGVDELTQWREEDYLYVGTRLRRLADSTIPLRVRCASNPGGLGHLWVKDRFRIKEIDGHWIGTHPKRAYVPAGISDNPYLDRLSYRESLTELDPITREQLLNGNWDVCQDARFKKSWARYYSRRGGGNDYLYCLGPDGRGKVWRASQCRCFSTMDPAASVREGPGDKDVWRNRQPSWTVISTFLLTPDNHLLFLNVRRFRKEIPDQMHELCDVYRTYNPEFICIEPDGLGIGTFQTAVRLGLPIRPAKHRSVDKLVQATDAINRMEQGRIWFPQDQAEHPWVEQLESEMFSWTGHPQATCDQIDTLATAALIVSSEAAYSESVRSMNDIPGAF